MSKSQFVEKDSKGSGGSFVKKKYSYAKISLLLLFSILLIPSHQAGSAQEKGEVLTIGIASMVTPVDTVKYYQEIVRYMKGQIGIPVKIIHRNTYAEMDRLLEKGEVKVAFICSAPYVKNRERFNIELLAAPSVNGKPVYHSYIIVHRESNINSFMDLKGKSFAFVDQRSNTGRLYPVYLLKKMGFKPEKFFGRIIYSYSHNKSIEMVAKKIIDGAAVDSLVYDYMAKSGSLYISQIKIVKRSPPFAAPPVVVRGELEGKIKEKLRDAFLNMHRSEKGREILKSMMIDRFVEISDSAYNPIRRMYRIVSGDHDVTKSESEKKTIYFGAIPRDNPRIMYEGYQPLLDYLSEKTPYRYELVLKKNYEETVEAMGRGEMDIAILGPLTYLEVRKKYGAYCILRPRASNGKGTYRSVIIKRKGSPIKTLSDLKGKSFSFSDYKSTSGNLIPRYMLAEKGIHLRELKSYKNFDYQESVVKAIVRGEFDAGGVKDSVARKYGRLGIEIVAISGEIPTGPVVVRKGLPEKIVKDIEEALLDLGSENTDSNGIINRLNEELKNGFMKASDNDYEGIRRRINDAHGGCGKGCHPDIRF